MNKLLNADISRIFKAKSLYYGMAALSLLALLFVFLNREENVFTSIPESGALVILPFFIGAVLALNISTEFTSGAIRNKLIIGHSRLNILLSWSVCFTLVTVLFFAVYEGAAFASAFLMSYDLSALKAGIVAENLLLVLVLVFTNMFLSLFICVVIEDVRSVAVMFILQFSMMMISTLGSEALDDSKAADMIFRFFPQGQLSALSVLTAPDRPWLTVLCALSAGAVMLMLSIVYFRKHDMK
ncbi:hypothetical protein [Ruminococcus flavefaciens]|uniref:hypothetical protein n=1 Tax=Ruminococcus flavefaciens TaxID=1265 RepID=UPI000465DEC9|nr:hypothetical protein [Ruminococcus flavefaciens]